MFALVLLTTSLAHAALESGERTVLLNLYNQTQGAEWTANTNWNGPAGSECTWYGVTCSGDQSHVVSIALYDNHLVGSLPEISGMTALQHFDLRGNILSGSIPPIVALSQLQYFDVSGPDFGGSVDDAIPVEGQGQLSGSLPKLTGLINLQTFDVSNNQLTGSVPVLTGLVSLESFRAQRNLLSGTLPKLDGLANLEGIYLYANQLEGAIPEFTGTPQLQYFIAAHNLLTGSIPALTQLTRLDTFLLEDNQLSGSLPQLADLDGLYNFSVARNRLTGTIPALTGIPELYQIDVSFNLLTGDVPDAPVSQYLANLGRSALCPNLLNQTESAGWDQLTQRAPWYADCPAAKVNLNQFGLTGAWYNPATSGQGFLLQSFPDINGSGKGILAGGWFTFAWGLNDSEPSTQNWYSLQGNVDATVPYVSLDIYSTSGGNFAAPPIVQPSYNGATAIFALSDCNHAILSYDLKESIPNALGSISLTRLTPNTTCAPSGDNGADGSSFLLSGAWYDPAASGQGLMFDINPQLNLLSAAWYTFAPAGTNAGAQRWYTLQTLQFPAGTTTLAGIGIYASSGGYLNEATNVTTTQVGTASVAFESCSVMTLSYSFSAGENANTSGSINLVRIGPPPAGCHL